MPTIRPFNWPICLLATLLLSACQSTSHDAAHARFVDVHMHLHPLGLDVTMGRRGRPVGPIDVDENLTQAAGALVRRMKRKHIKTAFIVVVPSVQHSPEEAYEQMRHSVASHPKRLKLLAGGAILGRIMQMTPPTAVTPAIILDFNRKAQRLLAAGAIGFGEMIIYHLCMNPRHSFQKVAADHPLFLSLADIAAQNDVPIDIHMEAINNRAPVPVHLAHRCAQNPVSLEPTIPALERLLRHNRAARIVWQHIGWDNTGQMTPYLLGRLLVAHHNLFMALRVPPRIVRMDGSPIPNRLVNPAGNIQPQWLRLLRRFPDRFVIGADEFIGPGQPAHIAASFDPTWAMLSQLPPDLAEKIGGENARRLYHLD